MGDAIPMMDNPRSETRTIGFMRDEGNLHLGINYASPDINDWMVTGAASGTVTGGFTDPKTKLITNNANNPGFADFSKDNLQLNSTSVNKSAGGALKAEVLPLNNITMEYKVHLEDAVRSNISDIGAYQYRMLVTQIKNNQEANVKVIYPIPAKDELFIPLDDHSSGEIYITDILGKQVYVGQYSQQNLKYINTTNFSSGIYIINISGENYFNTSKLEIKK